MAKETLVSKRVLELEAEVEGLVKKLEEAKAEIQRVASIASAALAAAETKKETKPEEKPWGRKDYPEKLLTYRDKQPPYDFVKISVEDNNGWCWITPKQSGPFQHNQWYIPMFKDVPMEVPLTVFEEVQRRKLAK